MPVRCSADSRSRCLPRLHCVFVRRGLRLTNVSAKSDRTTRWLLLFGFVAVALIVIGPWIFDSYLLNILVKAFLFSIVAITVDVLWGYTGYLTFGQSAFFGIGAYAAGLVFTHHGFSAGSITAALGFAVVVPAAVAGLVGWLS